MKYAALIFGDDERQPKAASGKLPSPEPGQIVRGIDGSVYRVASKITGPDGYAVKLANLQGQPVQTPHNFRPVAAATARFASWLKYHLAYNRDFDLYINAYIERYNEQHKGNPLPYPVGHDGKAFRWANWFQSVVSPKLYVSGRGDAEDKQLVKDELIHEMLFNVLGQRNVLDQFVSKAETFGGGVNKQNAAKKLTDFLIRTFTYRIDEIQNKIKDRNPEEEISMWQPSRTVDEPEGETNILETEEFGVGEEEFQSAEARRDIAKFRQGFNKWLGQTQGQKAADSFIQMFDIFWRILQTDEDADVKRSDLEQEWIKKTGLSFGSFKDYFTRLPDVIEEFITSHGDELGDKNIFIDLMNIIRQERTQRERKDRRQKERARPAMVSSLNTAGVEGDFTQAISNTENPDVVDPDIHQPTESVSEAAKIGAKDEMFTCMKCHRTSKASDSNNLQCPHCGGNMKTAEYSQEDWERDERAQHDLERIEEAKHWEGEDEDEKTASTHKVAKLMRGDQLTPEMVKQVQDAFIYRWTSDNKRRGDVYHCDKCDVRHSPYVNTNSAEGHQHPTIPLQTDDQWLKEHAFYFTNAGKLQPRRHAQPAYLVPEENNPILASVAHKFAMEKAAYNPGKGEYIYQSDVYCEACGDALKRRLDKKGYTPADPSDESSWDSDKYPKGPYYNQESDGPEHCARCGEFLENPLTTEGYQYLNQMILEHEEDGKGQSNIIDEWKAFYPEREQEGYTPPGEVDDTLSQIEQDTDKDFLRSMNTAGKKAMIPHEFNNADGQAIRNETHPDTAYVEGEADTTEFRQPRVGAVKTAIDSSSLLNVTEPRKPTPLHKRPQDSVAPTHPLQTRESETGNWQCMDCGAVGLLDNKGGGCETCGSQAVFPVSSTGVESPELVRETKPVEVEKRMIPRRSPKPLPLVGTDKTAQGSGGTTVTFQNQNVTNPNTPGKAEPMAVPEAINQSAGPHSSNAPATAPRTPGITPKIVNVPFGTEGETGQSNTASARDPEEVICPKCGGDNIDFDVDGDIVKTYCEDCEEVTHQGRLVPGSPVRDYREMPGDEWSEIERMGEMGGEIEDGPEPDVDAMYEAERLDQFDKQSGLEWIGGRLDEEERAFVRSLPESEMTCPDCGVPLRVNELADPSGAAEPKKDYICLRCESVFSDEPEHIASSDPNVPFSDSANAPAGELSSHTLPQMSEEESERWLEKHGWVKENEHHGATWWMQRQMWYKKDHEEDIPYQSTDDAIEKELELMDRHKSAYGPARPADFDESSRMKTVEDDFIIGDNGCTCRRCGEVVPGYSATSMAMHTNELCPAKVSKQGAGSNSGNDDDRGAGDLWREEFYEHRTKGLSTDGLLSGMKEGAYPDIAEEYGRNAVHVKEDMSERELDARGLHEIDPRLERKKEQRDIREHGSRTSAAAPAPVSPNVQQNMNLVRPTEQAPGPGGTTVAIMPGQEPEEPGGLKRHTVEPELPNAKYHMMSALILAEEQRLTEELGPEYEQWSDEISQQQPDPEPHACEQCGQTKPDVEWHVWEEFGDINDPTKPLEGFWCKDCALELAQDI